MTKSSILICIVSLASMFVAVIATPSYAHAVDARNFNAGKIIDDSIFTNSNSMTVANIQEFLNSKVSCDNWGVKMSEFGGGTRAQWMSARGITPPFRCVADYRENPETGQNNYSRNDTIAGAMSAAEIIYKYSKQFNINPQVIIATLQKENGLITDEWPTPKQYSEAMGFGCPDNIAPGAPACNPQFGSFSAQVYQAARHFRGYFDKPAGWWVSFDTGRNNILWSPRAGCGSSSVDIENRATVALYSYTPYRPNQAALNAQWGIGDSCSSYGNRNFFLFFNDWFGSVYGDIHMTSSLSLLSSGPAGLYTDGFVEASFILKNNSNQWRDVGTLAIAVRDEAGNNYDFGSESIRLAPYQEYLYRHSRNFTKEGKYTFWVTSYRDDVGWKDDYPSAVNGSERRHSNRIVQNIPSLSAGIDARNELRAGKESVVSFEVKNNSIYPVNLGYIGASLRDPDGANADLAFDTVQNQPPLSTYTYQKAFRPLKSGTYRATVISYIDNAWNVNYPQPNTGVANSTTLNVLPSPTVSGDLAVSSSQIRAGDSPNLSFKVKNYSNQSVDVGYIAVAVRDPNGRNVDTGGVELSALAPNQEYEFKASRKLERPGVYTAWIVNYKNGTWRDGTPVSDSESVKRKITFEVKTNPTLIEGMQIKRAGGVVGDKIRSGDRVIGSFKIKNYSSETVTVNKSLCYIIRGGSKNYDLGCMDVNTLRPGEERQFSESRIVETAGSYRAYFSMYDGSWHDNWTFSPETGSEPTTLQYSASENPTITKGLTVSGEASAVGSFEITNQANEIVKVNKALCMIVRKDDSNTNHDFGCLDIRSLQPGETVTFSRERSLMSGSYRAYFSMYDGSWHDNWTFSPETGSEPTTTRFVVP